MTLPPYTWSRVVAIALCAWIVYGSFRMVLVYHGVVRSSLGVVGSPALAAVSRLRGWVFLLSLIPLALAPWPAVITYLLGAQCVGSFTSLVRCLRKAPPFESVTPGDNPPHGGSVATQAGRLVSWGAATAVAASYLGLT